MINKKIFIRFIVFLISSCIGGCFSETNGLIVAILGAAYMICSVLNNHDSVDDDDDDTDD